MSTVAKNGVYTLKVESEKYRGESKLDIQSYEINGAVVVAEPVSR